MIVFVCLCVLRRADCAGILKRLERIVESDREWPSEKRPIARQRLLKVGHPERIYCRWSHRVGSKPARNADEIRAQMDANCIRVRLKWEKNGARIGCKLHSNWNWSETRGKFLRNYSEIGFKLDQNRVITDTRYRYWMIPSWNSSKFVGYEPDLKLDRNWEKIGLKLILNFNWSALAVSLDVASSAGRHLGSTTAVVFNMLLAAEGFLGCSGTLNPCEHNGNNLLAIRSFAQSSREGDSFRDSSALQ